MNNTFDRNDDTVVVEKLQGSATAALAQPFLKLFADGMRDMYRVEKHLVEKFATMSQATSSAELKEIFDDHVEDTEEQVARLNGIFSTCELEVGAGKCVALEAITAECDNIINECPRGNIRDAALIMLARKIEHYEIAGYGALRQMADTLHLDEAASQLKKTLHEEEGIDKALAHIGKSVNERAAKEANGNADGQK